MNTAHLFPRHSASRPAYAAALFILLVSIGEMIWLDSAVSMPSHPSETASQEWPSLTTHSPTERAHAPAAGEAFGYFPTIGINPLVTPVREMPIAGLMPPQWTPVRINTVHQPEIQTTVLGDVYLADDRPLVAADAAQLLASTAALLDQSQKTDLTLEAYCDERGTEAYSLVTGQQWTAMVGRRLQEMRVNKAKMTTVSYGTQQPSCRDNSAACWEDNLRMKWSIRLLSPVTSQRGCLIRLKIVSQGPLMESAAIQTDRSYLRRIQQGERSSSSLLSFTPNR
jgi:outer membrane protein OmpA-like peptidoglycan-associated protein